MVRGLGKQRGEGVEAHHVAGAQREPVDRQLGEVDGHGGDGGGLLGADRVGQDIGDGFAGEDAVDDQVGGVDACFGEFVGRAGRLGQR